MKSLKRPSTTIISLSNKHNEVTAIRLLSTRMPKTPKPSKASKSSKKSKDIFPKKSSKKDKDSKKDKSSKKTKDSKKSSKKSSKYSKYSYESSISPSKRKKLPKSIDCPKFQKKIRSTYGASAFGAMKRYHKFGVQLATYVDRVAFLQRCVNVRFVPKMYRLDNAYVEKTGEMTSILNKYSWRLLKADLGYNFDRKKQVEKHLKRLMYKLKKLVKARDDRKLIHRLTHKAHDKVYFKLRDASREEFRQLVQEYRKPSSCFDLVFSDEEDDLEEEKEDGGYFAQNAEGGDMSDVVKENEVVELEKPVEVA